MSTILPIIDSDLPIVTPQPPQPTATDNDTFSITSGGKYEGNNNNNNNNNNPNNNNALPTNRPPTKGKGKGKGKGKHGGKGKSQNPNNNLNNPNNNIPRNKPISRSELAILSFPVGRIHRRLRERLLRKQRCGPSAAVYMSAILEFLAAEVLELAVFVCKERSTTRIKPRELMLAIRGDEEISSLVTATISRGGVMPSVVGSKRVGKKKTSR